MNLEKFLNTVVGSKEREFHTDIITKDDISFYEEATQPFRTDKLYDTRKLNGEKNKEFFEVVREAENEFSPYPAFIGITPFGSQTKGYSTEESDFDLLILSDDSDPSAYDDLNKFFYKLEQKFKNDGKKVSLHPRKLSEAEITENIEGLVNQLITRSGPQDKLSCSHSEYVALADISALSHFATGEKVWAYRDIIKEKLRNRTEDQRLNFMTNIVNFWLYVDSLYLEKMAERAKKIDGTTEFNQEQWMASRKVLWTNRVHRIFGE